MPLILWGLRGFPNPIYIGYATDFRLSEAGRSVLRLHPLICRAAEMWGGGGRGHREQIANASRSMYVIKQNLSAIFHS